MKFFKILKDTGDRSIRIYRYSFLFFVLFVFCYVPNTYAGWKERIIKNNLPEFCIYTQGQKDSDMATYKKALKKFGFGWSYMHHYCNGLEQLNQAMLIVNDKKKQTFHLRRAINEFDFIVVRKKDAKLTLKHMVLAKKAYVLFLLKEYVPAFKNYQMAAMFKKNYDPAYLGMADCYLKLGDMNGAVQILKTGLKFNPESELLKKKIAVIRQ